MTITTWDEGKQMDVVCGHTEGDTYYRDVKMEHFMLKFWGFGIQKEVVDQLRKMGIKNVVLKTKKKEFKSTLDKWVKLGKVENFGHGQQVFLSTKFMQNEKPKI